MKYVVPNLKRDNVYKATNYDRFLTLVTKLRRKEIQNRLILIDNIYVYVFFSENYEKTTPINKHIIYPWVSNDFPDADLCITIYEDFFDLRNKKAQLFLLARTVGYSKVHNLRIPQYGIDKRRRDALKNFELIEEDLLADQYAAKVIFINTREVMLFIAEYIDRVFENSQEALEWRLRSRYVK